MDVIALTWMRGLYRTERVACLPLGLKQQPVFAKARAICVHWALGFHNTATLSTQMVRNLLESIACHYKQINRAFDITTNKNELSSRYIYLHKFNYMTWSHESIQCD